MADEVNKALLMSSVGCAIAGVIIIASFGFNENESIGIGTYLVSGGFCFAFAAFFYSKAKPKQ